MRHQSSALLTSELPMTLSFLNKEQTPLDINQKEIVKRLNRSIEILYKKINENYLIEFILQGQISVSERVERELVPGFGSVEYRVLSIKAGRKTVTLTPYLCAASDSFWVLMLLHDGKTDLCSVMQCNLQLNECNWIIDISEVGIRKFFAPLLPSAQSKITKELFFASLNEMFLIDQPIFINLETISKSFSDFINRATNINLGSLTLKIYHKSKYIIPFKTASSSDKSIPLRLLSRISAFLLKDTDKALSR